MAVLEANSGAPDETSATPILLTVLTWLSYYN